MLSFIALLIAISDRKPVAADRMIGRNYRARRASMFASPEADIAK